MSTTTPLSTTALPTGERVRLRVQRVGRTLSGMVMPNIGAFIAWGLITALFVKSGWVPNETLAKLIDPMISILLPVLIGYTGGRLVHGQRGAVVGAVATVGVAIGADTPMFLGAMIVGPLGGWLIKQFDQRVGHRVGSGFKMLVDNFSAGIIGGILAVLGLLGIGPAVAWVTKVLGGGVQALLSAHLLPLVSILIEPAKVLFLNNAVNHGVLSPLGVSEAAQHGKAVEFLLEPNPGAGLGLLLAISLFGPRAMRATAPGAAVIQFLGGIHEIYFPYVLAAPRLILAMIAGSASGILVFTLTNAGLTSAPSPGSIIAVVAVTPRGNYFGVLGGVIVAAVVSFVVASALMKFGRGQQDEEAAVASEATPVSTSDSPAADPAEGRIRKVVIACDAGMGSSVMVAAQLGKRLERYDVTVTHTPVDEIPPDADVVLCQESLAGRARQRNPELRILTFSSFLKDPAFDELESMVAAQGGSLVG